MDKITALRGVCIAFIVLAPLPFAGLIGRVKSAWAGRKGPRLLQPVFDVQRLLRKGEVVSTPTTLLYRIAPSVQLAAALMAATLVPIAGGVSLVSFDGDFVVFSYILALGKFLSLVAALETGSCFAGLGASREAFFGSLVEPGFFIVAGSLAAISGRSSFRDIFVAISGLGPVAPLVAVLVGACFFIMLLAEGSRLPVDDPATHLELTMVHEALILDYSGPDLAFIQLATAVKIAAIAALSGAAVGATLLPADVPVAVAAAVAFGLAAVEASAVGFVESLIARLRLRLVPQFILLMSALGLLALALILVARSGGVS